MLKQNRLGPSAALVIMLALTSCATKQADMVVATIGDSKVTLADYEALYVKSNGSREHGEKASQEEREKFLGLMTKFRLKLRDAYASGLDKDSSVVSEIDQYKGSLAASFLTEREVSRPGLERMYNRRKEELRASHILLSLPPGASSADSASIHGKAIELINAARSGIRFDSLAYGFSADPSAKQNWGDLYYFTAGQMVPAFEDAVYSMKPGETTSTPVRTQFGLHVIKVVDRKPADGERKVSHIMVRFDKAEPPPEDTIKALEKIRQYQDSLAAGADFAALAQRVSEDPGSAPRGGDLGYFSRRRFPQPFDEMAFLLKVDEQSPIVRTQYGYHIIKCFDAKPLKTFEEMKPELQQIYQQQRFQDEFKAYLDKLKSEMGFVLHGAVLTELIASIDTMKTTGDSAWWVLSSREVGNKVLMSTTGRSLTIDSTLAMIRQRPDLQSMPLRAAQVVTLVEKIAEQLVFTEKAHSLERENPQFAGIMKEYRDGILIYQVEQNRIWNRIVVNDSLLQGFYEQNKERFVYPDRVAMSEVRFTTDSLAREAYARVSAGSATLESLVSEDSIRMSKPTSFSINFKKNSAAISKKAVTTLKTAATELEHDPLIRIQLVTHPDTSRGKRKAEALAEKRTNALKAHLAKRYKIMESRIFVVSRPTGKAASDSLRKEFVARNQRVDVEIVGRRATALGGVQTGKFPVTLDERTKKADSLAVGRHTAPFMFRVGSVIVRLDEKLPSLEKTFAEAGTEVSSAFQEHESKRLEQEWLERLRTTYPVEEHKEVLQYAFAPNQ